MKPKLLQQLFLMLMVPEEVLLQWTYTQWPQLDLTELILDYSTQLKHIHISGMHERHK